MSDYRHISHSVGPITHQAVHTKYNTTLIQFVCTAWSVIGPTIYKNMHLILKADMNPSKYLAAILVSIVPQLRYIYRPRKLRPVAFRSNGLLTDRTTHCCNMVVKMNKVNYNQYNIKVGLFLEFPMYPQHLVLTVLCSLTLHAHRIRV